MFFVYWYLLPMVVCLIISALGWFMDSDNEGGIVALFWMSLIPVVNIGVAIFIILMMIFGFFKWIADLIRGK